jgi:hypothetical protein
LDSLVGAVAWWRRRRSFTGGNGTADFIRKIQRRLSGHIRKGGNLLWDLYSLSLDGIVSTVSLWRQGRGISIGSAEFPSKSRRRFSDHIRKDGNGFFTRRTANFLCDAYPLSLDSVVSAGIFCGWRRGFTIASGIPECFGKMRRWLSNLIGNDGKRFITSCTANFFCDACPLSFYCPIISLTWWNQRRGFTIGDSLSKIRRWRSDHIGKDRKS